ncbi:MAG: hypothetical protein U5K30_17860 [Acidimicrobiales bacterium]|nr:hypothetical protein [Acidimicrobiales bacterium]
MGDVLEVRPDAVQADQLDEFERLLESVDTIAARRQRPPKTRDEIIEPLGRQLPLTAEALRHYLTP